MKFSKETVISKIVYLHVYELKLQSLSFMLIENKVNAHRKVHKLELNAVKI